MKTKILLFFIFTLLGIGLVSSTWYEQKVHKEEIADYRCERTGFYPFPGEFNKYIHPASRTNINRFEDGFLNLRYNNLSQLPDRLFSNYSCVRKLNLQGNLLTEVPRTIRFLTDLELLHLNDNQITSLNSIKDLKHHFKSLESLSLEGNKIDTLDFFPVSEDLDYLSFAKNNIRHIDKLSIPERYKVYEIWLNDNQLRSIPAELLDMDTYKLILDDNDISRIEGDISFNRISLLSLRNNAFVRFPTELGHLDIQELEMEGNPLTGKVVIDGFNKLDNLTLSSGEIRSIDIDSNSLASVKKLDFSRNKIRTFKNKSCIDDKSNLGTLILSRNNLISFPSDVFHFKYLSKLDLSHNEIREIQSAQFEETSNAFITNLDLSFNELSDLSGIDSLKYLKILNLRNNDFTKIPTKLLKHNTIITLNLRENKIGSNVSIDATTIKNLYLSNNSITTFYLSAESDVEELDLSSNDLRKLIFEEGSLYRLEEIDISDNPNLKTFPHELLNQPNIKRIRAINIGLSEEEKLKWLKIFDDQGVEVILEKEKTGDYESDTINIKVRNN